LHGIIILERSEENLLTPIIAAQYPSVDLHHLDSPKVARKYIEELKPDLAIIDLDLIDGDIPDYIKSLRSVSPETTYIAASNTEDDKEIFLALKAGAKGYLLKDKEEDQIIKDLLDTLSGQPTVAPAITYQMLGYFHQQPNFNNDAPLSNRENEILKLIAKGLKRSEVASELNISLNTVATHLKSIYNKLNINNRAEATMEALRRGLIKK